MLSTAEELRQFEKSNIWKDIVEELMLWINEIRDNLESDDLLLEAVPKLQGSVKALRNVIAMLPIMAENIDMEEK